MIWLLPCGLWVNVLNILSTSAKEIVCFFFTHIMSTFIGIFYNWVWELTEVMLKAYFLVLSLWFWAAGSRYLTSHRILFLRRWVCLFPLRFRTGSSPKLNWPLLRTGEAWGENHIENSRSEHLVGWLRNARWESRGVGRSRVGEEDVVAVREGSSLLEFLKLLLS